ncbi:MAG: ROK family protein [Chloroflexi bacterium]|nr:ROK family protein [Chloroflexota bacterium]
MFTVGVDVGGSKIEAALVDDQGSVHASAHIATPVQQGPDGVIEAILGCIRQCLIASEVPVMGVGVGMAGQIDRASGSVHFAPNLGWRDVPLRARLEATLGLPVMVTNDVRAATWCEWRFGAGRGMEHMACLFVGTGIGGGLVLGGRLVEGHTNSAAEMGHMTIVAGGKPCRCGGRGCLEAYAGGWAIAQRAQEALQADPWAGEGLLALAGALENVSAATVSAAYGGGDPLAQRLVEETGFYLGAGAVTIVNAFNPQLLVLGGGVVEGLPVLVSLAEAFVKAHALEAANRGLRITRAALGPRAGVIGAADLTRARLGK